MSEADTRIIQHLYASARQLAVSQSALASLAGSRLFEIVSERKITLPDAARAEFCTWCKSPFVPGVNCSVNVQSRSRVARRRLTKESLPSIKRHDFQSISLSDSTGKRRNHVVYDCHICKTQTRFPGAISNVHQNIQTKSKDVSTPSRHNAAQRSEPISTSNSSKARKKRRKDLQTLINSNKQNKQQAQEMTFNLEDFLGQMN